MYSKHKMFKVNNRGHVCNETILIPQQNKYKHFYLDRDIVVNSLAII